MQSDSIGWPARLRAIAITVVAYFLISRVRWMPWFQQVPEDARVVLLRLLQVALCIAAVALVSWSGPAAAMRALGLGRPTARAWGFGFLATLPVLVAAGAIAHFTPKLGGWPLVRTGVVQPFSEEVIFRGYLFGQLRRRARLPFAWALLASVVPVAVQFDQVTRGGFDALALLEFAAVTALTAWFFAWLFERWGWDLWAPVAVHVLMSFYWDFFGMAHTTINAGLAPASRGLALVLAIGLTFAWTRRSRAPA